MPPPRRRQQGEFESRVVEVIRRLRPGEVLTYGEVAVEAGYPGAARAVGNVLARGDGLPWWRIVTATGRFVPGNEVEQARRLFREGVTVLDGRVAVPARSGTRRRKLGSRSGERSDPPKRRVR
jgi:methylated-DNA-protein-cysteine methyltransferase related protein